MSSTDVWVFGAFTALIVCMTVWYVIANIRINRVYNNAREAIEDTPPLYVTMHVRDIRRENLAAHAINVLLAHRLTQPHPAPVLSLLPNNWHVMSNESFIEAAVKADLLRIVDEHGTPVSTWPVSILFIEDYTTRLHAYHAYKQERATT